MGHVQMKRMNLGLVLASSLLTAGLGCDPAQPGSSPDMDDEREPLGKSDRTGSCAPDDCGGPASAGVCWCDEACVEIGDCCSDYAPVCEGDAPPSCNDGTSLNPLCDIKPPCDDGLVAAIQNGCFACVDAQTCEPPDEAVDCNDGSTLSQFCDIKPPCDEGEVAAIQGSCFVCVDEQTCEAG